MPINDDKFRKSLWGKKLFWSIRNSFQHEASNLPSSLKNKVYFPPKILTTLNFQLKTLNEPNAH